MKADEAIETLFTLRGAIKRTKHGRIAVNRASTHRKVLSMLQEHPRTTEEMRKEVGLGYLHFQNNILAPLRAFGVVESVDTTHLETLVDAGLVDKAKLTSFVPITGQRRQGRRPLLHFLGPKWRQKYADLRNALAI